jgi:hypothetical protein
MCKGSIIKMPGSKVVYYEVVKKSNIVCPLNAYRRVLGPLFSAKMFSLP